MKYYLCIVGDFEGADAIYEDCIANGIYQYHEDTRQKGAVSNIETGDILFLVNKKEIKGYGVAKIVKNNKNTDGWHGIQLKDGWKLVNKPFQLPYGVHENTIRGNKQSIVKEIKPSWILGILLQMRKMREENVSEQAFPVLLSELAIGLTTNSPFYVIPEIQRGLVWNSSRCEILWDSILRGFPIGAISLRATPDYKWEIFDGQQRTNAATLGYVDWPPKENSPILWIDLAPQEDTHGRHFVLMVTTPAHPWGYKLSDNERTDNRLTIEQQQEAIAKLKNLKCSWDRNNIKGARPYTKELWPITATLPVPFSLLRQFIEEKKSGKNEISYTDFRNHCLEQYSDYNWVQNLKNIQTSPEETSWQKIVDAIKKLSNYVVIALNGSKVPSEDLGLYFKRMNKQGVEPDDEEIRYSLLKSFLPILKKLDEVSKYGVRPSLLADIAVRFWLSKQSNWDWPQKTSQKIIEKVKENQTIFEIFIDDEFLSLIKQLNNTLLPNTPEPLLLPWHMREIYNFGHGDLILYFLRELNNKQHFIAIATTLLWFHLKDKDSKCVECLWNAENIQEGLLNAIKNSYLARLFTCDEIQEWKAYVDNALECDNWENGNNFKQSPYLDQALTCIWNGFHNAKGCSFLLFACRKFITEYFDGYDCASPEWKEQNRPWDYDHILPQDWVAKRRVSNRSYAISDFLWSIGNSAPIPFSLNRGKQAKEPKDYPDGTPESAQHLHINIDAVNKFKGSESNKLDYDKEAAKHFISTTTERIVKMLVDWYENCHISNLLSFDNYDDKRKKLLIKLQDELKKTHPNEEWSIWFVSGETQYKIHSDIDWARCWLSCGICGTILDSDNQPIECMLAITPDWSDWRKKVEYGIRRHPNRTEIQGRNEWWFSDGEKSAYNERDINEILKAPEETYKEILSELQSMKETYSFKVSLPSDAAGE